MDEEMNLDEYDHDINVEEFYKINPSKEICDDEDFLEKLRNEIERDMKQEQAKTDRYYEEFVKEEQNEGKCSNACFIEKKKKNWGQQNFK